MAYEKIPFNNQAAPGISADRLNHMQTQYDEAKTDLDAHLADYIRQPGYALATGAANTYAVSLSPVPGAYIEGMAVSVNINVENTGASTININGLGAKTIKKANGNDVSAGNLKAGSIYTLRYNGANFILQGSDAAGNATPADVLSGKTFTNDSGDQTGTMPNRGAVIITPSAVDQAILAGYHDGAGKVNAVTFDASKLLTGTTIAGTAGTMPNQGQKILTPGAANVAIPAGYHNGAGYAQGDANLVAGNIKNGVSIFGIIGTVVQETAGKVIYACGGNQVIPWTVYNLSGTSGIVSISDGSILFNAGIYSPYAAAFVTPLIDLTNYRYLAFSGYSVNPYEASYPQTIGIHTVPNDYNFTISYIFTDTIIKNFKLDVSSYNGYYYVKAVVREGIANGNAIICSNITLVP